MMRCTQEELDAFTKRHLEMDEDEAKPLTLETVEGYVEMAVDMCWPDIPIGFTDDQFMESYNRQLKEMTGD